MIPAAVGVLGNDCMVLTTSDSKTGMLTVLSFMAGHLDLGNLNTFWKIIFSAIIEFSSSVRFNSS